MTRLRRWLATLSTLPARALLLAILLAVTVLPLPAAVEAAPANATEAGLVRHALTRQAGLAQVDPAAAGATWRAEIGRAPDGTCIELTDRSDPDYTGTYCYRREGGRMTLVSERMTVCVFG